MDNHERFEILKCGEYNHNSRASATRVSSPIRGDVKTYVGVGLYESLIRRAVTIDHPQATTPKQVRSLVGYYRRKKCPALSSLEDLRS
ncbi:unnamed protein product [Didymodactylos carnosus]|uniref:Uncharacterized protein n=1 Tax=Didymodactylos carnosus TaxID=1234261 RepID=A0A8S2FQK5_9BILA|nr:unnamed protein product [Didymodactylos carnosus]CAF4319670.1 unnamed protein product [Didymodactylos carnosus]